MASLKDDLDSYMLMNEEKKSTSYMPNFKLPKILGGTSSAAETPTSNSWLQEDDNGWCPKMSRIQRMIACVVCLGLGAFCMIVSTFYIPVLVLKARKFSLLFSMGSLLLIAGFSFMIGFKSMFDKMFSKQKLGASIAYSLSLLLTLYFAMWARSTALTVVFAVVQIIALGFMLFGVAPKGTGTGFKLFGNMFKSQVSSSLPI